MNFDKYLDKTYNESKYNCAHFVCEVWQELTGQDISVSLSGVLCGQSKRSAGAAHKGREFERLQRPVSPCLALFSDLGHQSHIGIYLDGRILHLARSGVEWTFVETILINFKKVRYYNVKKDNNS